MIRGVTLISTHVSLHVCPNAVHGLSNPAVIPGEPGGIEVKQEEKVCQKQQLC